MTWELAERSQIILQVGLLPTLNTESSRDMVCFVIEIMHSFLRCHKVDFKFSGSVSSVRREMAGGKSCPSHHRILEFDD